MKKDQILSLMQIAAALGDREHYERLERKLNEAK